MRAIDADALKEDLTRFYDNEVTARKLIDEQPTIQPEPHWIPVTERLPEKSGRYYVTEWVYHIDDKKHEGKHTKRVNFAEYSATEKKWRRAQALVVVAWMDNEPYKGVNV